MNRSVSAAIHGILLAASAASAVAAERRRFRNRYVGRRNRHEEVIVTGTRTAESGRQDSRRHQRDFAAGSGALARAHRGRHRSARAHRSRLFRIVAGHEHARRDAARPCAAAPVRRHSAEHADCATAAATARSPIMDIVGRIEVINGPSAAEGIGAAGGIINYISEAGGTRRHRGRRQHEVRLAVRGRQRQLEGRRHRCCTSRTRSTSSPSARSSIAASPTIRERPHASA